LESDSSSLNQSAPPLKKPTTTATTTAPVCSNEINSSYKRQEMGCSPADNFESKEEAQKYLESYKKKLNNHRLDKFGSVSVSVIILYIM
jgi:hypothetical protein